MQTCILALGILLAGQLSDSSETRYPAEIAPPSNDQQNDQQTWANEQPAISPSQPAMIQPEQKNPLRSVAPAASLPATPATRLPPRQIPVDGLTKVTPATDLFQRLAKPAGRDPLAGVPLSLAEAVQNASTRTEQTERVKLYWELSCAVTDYHLASLEELELQSLSNGLAQPGPFWGAAQQAIVARKQITRQAAQVAQLRLRKVLGKGAESRLPRPIDLPHCGAYKTKYEQIFRGRSSLEAQQLRELLSLRHEQLDLQAGNAASAREWLLLVRQRLSPQDDSTQLLKAYEQLALQRQAFVKTAYQYNANIARYTDLAVPQEIGTGRLVAMLIQSEGNVAGNIGSVQQATAEQPLPQQRASNTRRYKPKTFADPKQDKTPRIPAGRNSAERSILVAPKRSQAVNGL